MLITPEIILEVSSIVDEFCLNHQSFQESPKEFCNKQNDDGLILITINSNQIINDSSKIAIRQLYMSKAVNQKVRTLAKLIQKKADINSYASELINPLLEFFCTLMNAYVLGDTSIEELIKNQLPLAMVSIKKQLLKKRTFGFPYHMMGLSQNINLTDSISIELSQDDDLDKHDKESYLYDRHFLHNAYLKVSLNEKISSQLGLDRAKKVSVFVTNFINFYCHLMDHDYYQHSPCISSNAKIKNYYEFHLDFIHRDEKSKSHTRRFPYDKAHSERHWKNFIEAWVDESYKDDKAVIYDLMSLSLKINKRRRVVDIIYNAINWYSDAFVEDNKESQIVKCVTAIESLVNYAENKTYSAEKSDDGGVTEKFRIRVGKLYDEIDRSKIESQAKEIYGARSDIVHGSGLQEPLSFCPMKFCRKTIHNALGHFYHFGLERCDYKKELPIYIGEIK